MFGYLECLQRWHGQRSFRALLDHHLQNGFPEGDLSTIVSAAWSHRQRVRFFLDLYLLIPTNQDITNKTGSTFTCLFIFRWSEFMKAAPSGWSTIHCELLSLAPPIDKQRICSSWVWDTLSKRPVAYEAGLDTNENNWKLETYMHYEWQHI